MPNKRLLALSAALLSVAIAGCDKAEDGEDGSVGVLSLFDPIAANPSLCGSAAIPFPNNALFSGTTDATLNIPLPVPGNPADARNGLPTLLNFTDGFSTTAQILTDVLGKVDYATAESAVVIYEFPAGAPPRRLVHGVDYVIRSSPAMAQVSGFGTLSTPDPLPANCPNLTFPLPARFQPISDQRSRILIEPLKPLRESTTYIVGVTKALKSRDGVTAEENEFFRVVNSDTKLCDVDNTDANPALLDCTHANAAAAAAAASSEPVIRVLFGTPPPATATQTTRLVTLETLRKRLVRPTVTTFKAVSGLTDADLVIAWSFTTQSITTSLSGLNTSTAAPDFQVAFTGISTGDLGLGLLDTADVWAGVISTPYYLANSGGNVNSTAPLTTFWLSADTVNPVPIPALSSPTAPVLCTQVAKSTSTSICYPDPLPRPPEVIPVLITVPNANSGKTKPDNGWPVAIFQHGITGNRTNVLPLAPALALAGQGFVVVAIDHPLHGVTNNSANIVTNPFYRNQIFLNPGFGGVFNGLMTGERTFDLDRVDNSPDPNPCLAANNLPDNVIDSSGTHFVNLSSPITTRDNLRQSEADILNLARSIAALDLDQDPSTLTATDIDETQVRFVGQSLGAIAGITVLGLVDNTLIQAASLHVPGGGLGKLLDASASFGPRVATGLSCNGVFEGTETYETFVRFAQHLVDPADPINYAAAANANHALHLVEVIGDTVVPNSARSTCPSLPSGITTNGATADAAGTLAAAQAAGAAIIAGCPPLVLPADAPLPAITYQDEILISGFLSGTDPLIDIFGLTNTRTMGNAPFAAQANAGADTVVQFAPDTAEHSTLLTPHASTVDTNDADTDPTNDADATFLCATREMQTQTAAFLASNGALLPIGGGSCP